MNVEPVECYAAKKIIDLIASVGPSDTALVGLRNLAVLLGQAYGISIDESRDVPKPGYYPILESGFLPIDEEKRKKAWKRYREALHLSSAVLAKLAELCHDRLTSLSKSSK